MTRPLEKVLYTAKTHTTGGRDGAGASSDGALDVRLSPPGSGKPGTNPEQLFGVGYSACFMGAMHIVAAAQKITLPQGMAVDASVSLGRTENDTAYGLAVTLAVSSGRALGWVCRPRFTTHSTPSAAMASSCASFGWPEVVSRASSRRQL